VYKDQRRNVWTLAIEKMQGLAQRWTGILCPGGRNDSGYGGR